MNNKVSAEFSVQSQQEVKSLIEQIEQQMPFLQEISDVEKKGKQNMGDGAVSFVNTALNIAQNEPNILTVGFDTLEFQKDVDLINALQKTRQQLMTLLENINNIMRIGGQEAMQQSNEVYANVKIASKKDSKYKILAEELGEFYKKTKKSDKTEL